LYPHISEVTVTFPVFIPNENPFNFQNNVSCEEDLVNEIDYSEYFTENLDFENLGACGVNNEMNDFENNKDFIDVIFSIKKDGDIEEYTHTLKDPFAGQDKIIGGYCYISFTLGNRKIAKIETVSKTEIINIRKSAKQDFIWKDWFEEKAKVAIIRRGCKVIFAGLNNEQIDNLVNKDNENFDLNQETKSEPKVINDLPKVDFEVENEVVEEQEATLTQEEIDAIKAEEFRVAKEGE
jgi:hypothetical protein